MRFTRFVISDRSSDNRGGEEACALAAISTWSINVYGNHVADGF